jgi:hypothetical protein
MMKENTMTLDVKIRKAIAAAIALEENRNEDGSINWSFVDADLWMDGVITNDNQYVAYEWFDGIATEFEVAA